MKHYLILAALSLLCASCAAPAVDTAGAPATQPAVDEEITEQDWVGVYASTSEVGGFTGTVLALDEKSGKEMGYRLRFRSDVIMLDAIRQDMRRGSCLTEGRVLYLPEAYGFMLDDKPVLLASITRYTLVEINGHQVLMRDDALQAFREHNKLYDYGILVKVKDEAGPLSDFSKVEHPSIKVLYADPARPWNDPFVHGPNDR